MANVFFNHFGSGYDQRLLAMGGIHTFERQDPCKLTHSEPEGLFKDLEWQGTLALEAKNEGSAEILCGNERIKVRVVAPARLKIELVDADGPATLAVDERFKVQARLYDQQGNELEVGRFTIFEWTSSDILEVANDRSSGEFGFSDTSFGMHNFRAVRSGQGTIRARLGALEAELVVTARS